MLLARPKARTRTEAQVAASRLPSFHFQTRTRTVIGRPLLRSQFRFASSGSHSPPRWRNARAPMRSSPSRLSFVRLGDMSLPFARGELFRTSATQLLRPSGKIQRILLPKSPVTRPSSAHTERRVLAEPSKDNKIQGWGQFFFVNSALVQLRSLPALSRLCDKFREPLKNKESSYLPCPLFSLLYGAIQSVSKPSCRSQARNRPAYGC
jgi:hypothetical protein